MATLHPDPRPDLDEEDEDRTPFVERPPLWSPGSAHWFTIVAFVAGHVALGAFSDLSPPPLASMHAFITLVTAVWLVGVRRNAEAMTCIAAYVGASDVLWRMTSASVPWEVSKIALIVIFAIAAARIVRRPRRIGLPLLSLILLAPSAVVTLERFGLGPNGRERLSFELAAHVALVFGVVVLGNLRVERQTLAGILWVIIGPVVTVNTIATSGTIGLQAGDYAGNLSNTAASGGYGPNQVSALIGVGAMLAIFLVFFDRRPPLRLFAAVLAVWFLAQSALTFSRGGSFNIVVALIVAIPFFLRTAQMAMRFFAAAALGALVIGLVMVPVIQGITGNQFGERFTSSDPTLRTDLMRSELEAWGENIALGVGVGMMERTVEDEGAAERGELPELPTHTEYTRLLAEHGLLGLGVILVLIGLGFRAVRRQTLLDGRIFSIVLVAWCATEVGHSATRLGLVPLLFALASIQVVPNGALEAPGHPSGPDQRQRPVEDQRPPAVARPRRRQDDPGDLAPAGEPAEVRGPPVGGAVERPGGDGPEPELRA
ncbi:MAG TPA: O-antigen ligase family protein [Acidimicrobiales bacterium]|nr:O-antigen ligase family protein [Acidimicrobiales bacterium]